ncbi:MAG: aminoglycoside phosphotransferase family protein [Candidatus Nanopelagicales bacterium]
MSHSADATAPLRHGYTNKSYRTGDRVTKQYVGAGSQARCRTETGCLECLQGTLPVPPIVARSPRRVTTAFIGGEHGQDLIEQGMTGLVLRLTGELLRQIQRASQSACPQLHFKPGQVLVHGDFGPQNLLIEVASPRVTALLDWEFAHAGKPIEDLAWAEWCVRMHHPSETGQLPELFESYGGQPDWDVRQAEMVRQCERLIRYVEWQGAHDAAELWKQRALVTQSWSEQG